MRVVGETDRRRPDSQPGHRSFRYYRSVHQPELLRAIGPSANGQAHLRYTRMKCKLPADYFWATLTDEGFLGHTSVHPLGWLIWQIGENPPQESIGSRHSC
jgi:hypothetical protein